MIVLTQNISLTEIWNKPQPCSKISVKLAPNIN